MLTRDDLLGLNHTEAYQLCRDAGIDCLPGEPKETLIDYLLGTTFPPPPHKDAHPIDSWRNGIAGFVMDHWEKLQPQLTCPIRSGDPRSCFGCLDTQVLECVAKNAANQHLIQLHKKGQP